MAYREAVASLSAVTFKTGSFAVELLQEILVLILHEVLKPRRLPHLASMDSGFLLESQREYLMDDYMECCTDSFSKGMTNAALPACLLLSCIPLNECDTKYGLRLSCVSEYSAEPKLQAGLGPRCRDKDVREVKLHGIFLGGGVSLIYLHSMFIISQM